MCRSERFRVPSSSTHLIQVDHKIRKGSTFTYLSASFHGDAPCFQAVARSPRSVGHDLEGHLGNNPSL